MAVIKAIIHAVDIEIIYPIGNKENMMQKADFLVDFSMFTFAFLFFKGGAKFLGH